MHDNAMQAIHGQAFRPSRTPTNTRAAQVLQVYCGHFYHFKCVDEYVSAPPFGKACHTCGVPLEHALLTTDVRVLEARWASKQAKERELDDIRTFLL